jgi:UDP-N-acetylglucosamine 2-epimerase (non-hydrolysing)
VDEETIFSMANTLLADEDEYKKMSQAVNPYGDGNASKRTVDAILYYFGKSDKRPEDFSY